VRVHTGKNTPDQEPWSFGPEVEAIARRYIRYRYRLLPYYETLFEEAARTGAPIMRPLFWAFPDDPVGYTVSDQFMVGDQLLVAPVVQPGARERLVYLPAGRWYDPWQRALVEGGRWLVAEAPLDRVPLFVRAGAVIPLGPEVLSTQELSDRWASGHDGPDQLWIVRGSGQFTVYSDDGVSWDFRRGSCRRIQVQVQEDAEGTLTVRCRGQWPATVPSLAKAYTVYVAPYDRLPRHIAVQGTACAASFDAGRRLLEVTWPEPIASGQTVEMVIRP
jgi:alpha-glucosidase